LGLLLPGSGSPTVHGACPTDPLANGLDPFRSIANGPGTGEPVDAECCPAGPIAHRSYPLESKEPGLPVAMAGSKRGAASGRSVPAGYGPALGRRSADFPIGRPLWSELAHLARGRRRADVPLLLPNGRRNGTLGRPAHGGPPCCTSAGTTETFCLLAGNEADAVSHGVPERAGIRCRGRTPSERR